MSEQTDSPEAQPEREPAACDPCRGTGKVISNLGGEPKEIDCPWCEGTGQFIPGHDAQGRQRGEEDGQPAT